MIVTIADYPELKLICWNVHVPSIDGETAYGIYMLNWRFVSTNLLTENEQKLIAELAETYGSGVLPFWIDEPL